MSPACLIGVAPRRILSSVMEPNVQRSAIEFLPENILTTNPLGDAAGDMNKFFEISDESFTTSFPQGVDSGLEVLFQRLDNKKRLMVRGAALGLIDILRSADKPADESGGPKLVVLSSEGKELTKRGVGKTSALLHAVHWARANGWLVLHVQDAKFVMEGGWWVKPSEVTPGDFDQPQVAEKILGDFLAAHASLLESLPLQTSGAASLIEEYEAAQAVAPGGALFAGGKGERVGEEEGATEAEQEAAEAGATKARHATLKDLCGLGVVGDRDPKRGEVWAMLVERFGSRALLCLRQELSVLKAVPVLVAIDEYNLLFGTTKHFFDEQRLEAEQLVVVQALRDLSRCATKPFDAAAGDGEESGEEAAVSGGSSVNGGWLKRGVVVVSETNKHPNDSVKGVEYFDNAGANLRAGKSPAGVLRLPVGRLDEDEFASMCDFFAASEVLNGDSHTLRGILRTQSQQNPRVLLRRIMLT
eukprot:CAMPEP_0171924120 /NCGR_PEP_ID=MMETSP0993-20121228/22704_1 /TAXON_ID=483369 /ORGANISM="non described non described, Strain CCMP2098" /LENGTH=472 /DNA_ID=CAMNT_0012562305 /DNA_START=95 /DNA_END=1513 /DNA_ORIENTATION=-